MNQLIYFLQSIEDEVVMRFIFSNLTKSGTDQLFKLLEFCDNETEERWQTVYSEMFTKVNKKLDEGDIKLNEQIFN